MTWTLDIVDVGTIPGLPLSQFLPDAAPDEAIDVPCFAYLLTRPGRTVLVDSGPDVAAARRHGFGPTGDAADALRRALAARGREPRDVQLIVHTHLHYDHAQNHGAFPGAVVAVQAGELDWALGGGDGFVLDVPELVADLGDRLAPLEGEQEPEEGLRLVPTGGHTPGHQAVLVRTTDGDVCLAADVLPLGANRSVTPPNAPDGDAVVRFRARAQAEGWPLVPGHDPQVRAALAAGRDWHAVAVTTSTTDNEESSQ